MSYYKSVAGFFKAGFDTNAQAYFTAAGITDATQKSAWNTFVLSAKSNGYYSKILAAYPLLGSSSSTCSYNAINTTTFQISWVGSVSYTSNGIAGTSGGYGDTSFGSGSGWSASSASFGCYSRNIVAAGESPMGDGVLTYLYSNNGLELIGSSQQSAGGTTASTRLILVNDNGTVTLYRDGATVGTNSTAHSATLNNSLKLLTYAPGSAAYNGTMSFAFIGTALTPTDVANLNTDINTFMTTLGRNV